jgi:hypothetical protein
MVDSGKDSKESRGLTSNDKGARRRCSMFKEYEDDDLNSASKERLFKHLRDKCPTCIACVSFDLKMVIRDTIAIVEDAGRNLVTAEDVRQALLKKRSSQPTDESQPPSESQLSDDFYDETWTRQYERDVLNNRRIR